LPGNPGTGQIATNVDDVPVDDHAALASFCKAKHVDLVIVGPEIPLANGLVDSLANDGIRCFGPSQAAAEIESSKVFAKDFMVRHNIPTARYATFTQLNEALSYLDKVDYPIVIKASGLAAGKGVILPETDEEAKSTLEDILIDKTFGDAGNEVVIEERMVGQEVSLMAFTDGISVVPMISAQDHKRLLDGDNGPNTGGMGAYAPAPVFTNDMLEETMKKVLQPAVDGMRNEGRKFVGVLYAGLMLTSNGIRVLEFNCRFGDPETQVVLPLLETDLVEIANACVDGRLNEVDVRWKNVGELPEDMICFHAGTKQNGANVVTAGGRVFGLTAWAGDIGSAVEKAYANIDKATFDGAQYRKDIAHRALS